MNLEDSPLDLSNGMQQIAAYLQHIYCKWWYLKNYEFSQDETQDIVSLESDYTSYRISWCCRNYKCCSNMLQQPEVQQQRLQNGVNVKLRLLVHFYMRYWSGRLPLWSKQQYAADCSILQHICSTSIGRGFKLRKVCQIWVTSVFLHCLLICKAPLLIQVTVCCKLQRICSTFVANGDFSKIMNSVWMKLRI